MKAILLLSTIFFASLLPVGAAAANDGILIGTVIDAESRQPIAAAVISILGTNYTTRTGKDGQYRIDGLPEGFYQIKAEAPKFDHQIKNNVYVGAANDKVSLFFTLFGKGTAREAGEVDEQPSPIQPFISPKYPDDARKKGMEGTVFVKLLVSERGDVKQTEVVQSDAEIFNQASIDAAMKWRFTPGKKNGVPVATWVVLPFKFKLDTDETKKK